MDQSSLYICKRLSSEPQKPLLNLDTKILGIQLKQLLERQNTSNQKSSEIAEKTAKLYCLTLILCYGAAISGS
jgi:hypothetical protein